LSLVCCGSGSGVSSSEPLRDLTSAQAMELCAQWEREYPATNVTCNGSSETIGGSGSCAMIRGGSIPADCPATAGQAEACVDATYNDPCMMGSGGDACVPLALCGGSG